jgi:hypothetical protein
MRKSDNRQRQVGFNKLQTIGGTIETFENLKLKRNLKMKMKL